MSFTRRNALQAAAASTLMAGIGRNAWAQAQIETARIITGFAAGGTSDTICRRVAQKLQGDFAKTAVVENKTGAGGQIAVQTVKAAAPDGANILQTPTSILTIYPHIYKKLAYEPLVDLTPVTLGCVFDFGLAVGPAVPLNVKTVPEFLAWAKVNPLGANFGSPAAGSTPHFIGALLGKNAGVDLKHAAYRGTQPAMLDLLGGNVSAVSGPIGDLTQHLPTGKVRILGVSGAKRNRFAPDVPTYEEQGIKNATHSEWFAFFLPGGASDATIERGAASVRQAASDAELGTALAGLAIVASASSPAQMADRIAAERQHWTPIIRAAGITVNS